MTTGDLSGIPAQQRQDRPMVDAAPWSGIADEEFWCPLMVKSKNGGALQKPSSTVAEVCDRLRAVFNEVAGEPIPDQLNNLADLLDSALEKGELFKGKIPRVE